MASLALAACSKPQPRHFTDFMEDRFAREGTLARCNADREATLHDLECANARRAAAAIALQEERARREALEIESEAKIEALRAEVERERQRALAADAAKEAAEKAAYEALWGSKNSGVPGEQAGVDDLEPDDVEARKSEPGVANLDSPPIEQQ
jgi:hypothetical protein